MPACPGMIHDEIHEGLLHTVVSSLNGFAIRPHTHGFTPGTCQSLARGMLVHMSVRQLLDEFGNARSRLPAGY